MLHVRTNSESKRAAAAAVKLRHSQMCLVAPCDDTANDRAKVLGCNRVEISAATAVAAAMPPEWTHALHRITSLFDHSIGGDQSDNRRQIAKHVSIHRNAKAGLEGGRAPKDAHLPLKPGRFDDERGENSLERWKPLAIKFLRTLVRGHLA
jgi:hypothetical protein